MQKDVILTPEGLEKLKDELEQLSTAKRREIAERIKEAREFGDISENSEYDDAKNEQAMIESRIAQLQEKLRMATVIETKDISTDVVQVGSVVHVKDEKTGKSVKYTIVGSAEAKPLENKLSNESPVGRALLGPQAQRDSRREGSARTGAQAEDHQDRRRPQVASPHVSGRASEPADRTSRGRRHGLPELIAERRAKAQRLREADAQRVSVRVPGR